jgi:hypothetical protein
MYTIFMAVTEASDKYFFLYKEPTNVLFSDIIKMVWEMEGEIEDLNWYLNTTSVYRNEHVVVQNSEENNAR